MKKIRITNQIAELMSHALGLGYYKKMPYRNYYNTGDSKSMVWEDLCEAGWATRRDTSKSCGGYYYHLTDKGLWHVLDKPKIFGLDRRIKKLETLSKKAN